MKSKLIISHRGNINGINERFENDPFVIENIIAAGHDVEIDVWFIENKWYLGHDYPMHQVDLDFLNNKKLWCHAKNLNCLKNMLNNGINCFWHQEDDFTLTSSGIIWTYPGKKVCDKSVIVCNTLEEAKNILQNTDAFGICTDFLEQCI